MALSQHVDRWAWRVRRPSWRRADLAAALDPSIPVMGHVAGLLAQGDDGPAHRALSAHFVRRPSRFLLAPHAREAVARLVRSRFPTATADARRRADRTLCGCVDVLGYRDLCFATKAGDGIDWHLDPVHQRRAPIAHWSHVPFLDPAVGDHKIIWELNRHQHWLLLGRAYCLTRDTRYRVGFIEQLGSWLAANPPRTGINWASMLELAFRALSWTWALHMFVEGTDDVHASDGMEPRESAWTVDLLLGLHAQLTLVERHLSTYFSPNTHLLGEALALYVAGRALPELGAAARWAQLGRRVLVEQIDRQIHPDGGHAELSTHYHRYTLDFYLLALGVARITADDEAAAPFERAAGRLARFAHTLSDRHYQLPQLGDDDGGQLLPLCGNDALDAGPSLAIAAAMLSKPELSDGRPHEEVLWVTGKAPPVPRVTDRRISTRLPDSGYVVSRTWRGDHLVMDVGRLGYLNAGHAHADALSVTLTVAGRPLLIDPGTGCYTVDPAIRDRLRATASHNTVTVDGRSQSEPAGPFHWRSTACASLDAIELTPRADYVEASHDGYGPDGHRRQLLARPGCWIVVDWIGGAHRRSAAAHWHLDPAWRVHDLDGGRVELRHLSGARLWMLTLGNWFEAHTGQPEGLGWHAPTYGVVRPTTTLRVTRSAAPPFAVVTVLVECEDRPVLEPLHVATRDGASTDPLAFRLSTPGWHEVVVAPGPAAATVDGTAYGIAMQGRFLCARISLAGPVETWVVLGSYGRSGAIGSHREAIERTSRQPGAGVSEVMTCVALPDSWSVTAGPATRPHSPPRCATCAAQSGIAVQTTRVCMWVKARRSACAG